MVVHVWKWFSSDLTKVDLLVLVFLVHVSKNYSFMVWKVSNFIVDGLLNIEYTDARFWLL